MSTERATCWSVTINNPTPQDEEYIALVRQKGWKVSGQLERGVEGTPHYQLMIKTPQVRFSQVKKALPRAHIEVARNVAALSAYVEKSETAVAPLRVQQEKYPSLSQYWKLVWAEIDADPHLQRHLGPNGRILREQATNILNEATSKLIRKGYYVESLACNPLVIAQWKQFHPAIRDRISSDVVDIQTDRHAELISQSVVIPTDALQETPTLQAPSTPPQRRSEDDEGSSQTE